MIENIKLAFFDLDGTLTNNEKKVTDNTVKALKKLKNNNTKIVYCSGRWDSYILDSDYHIELVDYIICNNGSEIYDVNNKKIILSKSMNKETVKYLVNYCNKYSLGITFNGLLNRYDNNITEEELNNPIYLGVIICNSISDINKFIQDFKDHNELYISYISAAYYKNILNKSYTLNINQKNSNKGEAIKYLQQYLNINMEDCICFGDNSNDIPMFDACGIKVAMENGYQILKDKADYVTKNNDEDGVAYFINNYIK